MENLFGNKRKIRSEWRQKGAMKSSKQTENHIHGDSSGREGGDHLQWHLAERWRPRMDKERLVNIVCRMASVTSQGLISAEGQRSKTDYKERGSGWVEESRCRCALLVSKVWPNSLEF